MIRKDREAPEHEQKIKELFNKGMRGTKIAKELGLCRKLVNRIIFDRLKLRSDKPRSVSKLSDEQASRIAYLYMWGYTCKEIAEDQKVPAREINRIIHQTRIEKKV